MIYEMKNTDRAAHLFQGWQETMIWSCLQGVMGHIYADDVDKPVSAMAVLADFCFLAGRPNRELASYKPKWCTQDFMIIVPQNGDWAEEIERCYADNAKKVTRYAMKKEQDVFDRGRLRDIVGQLSLDFEIPWVFYKVQ